MKKYTVELKQRSYDINIKPGIIKELPLLLSEYNENQKWIIISQHKIMELFGYELEQKLKLNNFNCFNITLPNGEAAKSINEYNRAIEQMIDFECDRKSIIIALGGGVVGDVSGFIASTFMRGINYFQVPTTLLSMVDSSIGGKTGINIPQGKNLVGTIYQPKGVFIDQDLLKTLPAEEVISGLGEIIKYGAILDSHFFNNISNWVQDLPNFPFAEAIEKCCKLKADIVSRDELDNNLRAILNFGHTIGHALELKFGFNKLKHGEAVAYGMLSASYVSHKLKKIDKNQYKLLNDTIKSLPLPKLKKLDSNEILTFIKRDKKYIKGKLNYITLKRIGEAEITAGIQDNLIVESLNKL
ncbi:3-dehydroquinate synthase [bacterium]|nr:MAG: 3-dehydroquinate synthase [bacterium]